MCMLGVAYSSLVTCAGVADVSSVRCAKSM